MAGFYASDHLWQFPGSDKSFDLFFYLLGTFFIVLQILFGGFRRWTAFMMPVTCGIVYVAGRLIIDGEATLFVGERLSPSMIAIILLLFITWVAGIYGSVIADFRQALEELILLKEKDKVQLLGQAQKDIQQEIDRSRRYNHPFSIVIFEPDKSSMEEAVSKTQLSVQQSIINELVFSRLGNTLNSLTRRPDFVVYLEDKGRFVIVCPETTAKPAETLVKRVKTAVKDQLGIQLTSGTATFPMESLTFDELMVKASSKFEKKQECIELVAKQSHVS